MGCKGRAFDDCTGLTRGYLQEEPKAGTGTDLHDLAKNKNEKTEEQADKKGQLHARSALGWFTCLAVPCA